MDLNQRRVAELLREQFTREHVVFWNDADQQFADAVSLFELGDEVEILLAEQMPVLALKRQLEESKDQRFLIYSTEAVPDPGDDWLLDVRLRSKTFTADLTSILIEDLGLSSLALASHIRARSKFLAAEARRTRLKKLIEPSDQAADIDRKMIAVLLRTEESDALSLCLRLLHGLWVAGSETIGESPKAWSEIQSFDLEPEFWSLMNTAFGYSCDAPGLTDLLLRLLATDFVRGLGSATPEAIKHWVLPSGPLAGNASILCARWRNDVSLHASYAELSSAAAKMLQVDKLIASLPTEALIDCITFATVEIQIIRDLRDRIVANGAAVLAEVKAIASRRREGHWASAMISDTSPETRAIAASYDALEAAAEFLSLKERFASGISFGDAEAAVDAYRSELYRFDQLYRWFHHGANGVEPVGWSVLHPLREMIEQAYSGWFIPMLSSAWGSVLEGDGGLLSRWQLAGIGRQDRFFDHHVAEALSAGTAKRVFVVISDAFRYEAGEELVRRLNSKSRFTAELSAMLSVLPSYTSLGMAALLPHVQLSYKAGGSGEVLADGHPTSTLDARRSQLARFDGAAIRVADLLALGKNKGREWVGDHRVLYIYHDKIDLVGDKQSSEEQTFQAVDDTLRELSQVLSFVINNLNGSLIFVTADHGFLYQESALDQASKAALDDKPKGTLRAKKRYLLGRDLPDNPAVWQGSTQLTAGTAPGEGSVDYWLPKGAMRFHFAGGARFVHGSAMPQEVIVPLITVRESESAKAKTRPVEIKLMGLSNRVVTNTQRLELVQTEPVSARVLARTVRIVILDGDKPISDEQTVTFDSASTLIAERVRSVILTVRAGTYDRQKDYFLVARDTQSKLDVLREALRIDLAFSNDF